MRDSPPISRVAQAFDRAEAYDDVADVQRAAAGNLARKIAAEHDGPVDSILEIGCGTGFLTRAIAHEMAIAPPRWIVSDIAPAMVERARQRGPAMADYRVIDGEAIDPAIGQFDLICSSLAFQWFNDLPRAAAAMQAMLNPGGLFAFATMARGSFHEWRAAHRPEGHEPGTPDYPDAVMLRALAAEGIKAEIEIVDVPQPEADARAFLHRLKAIGAGTPRGDHAPLDGGTLRRIMRRFDAGERIATYRIAFCLFRAPKRRRP